MSGQKSASASPSNTARLVRGYYICTAVTILSAAIGLGLAHQGQAAQAESAQSFERLKRAQSSVSDFEKMSIELSLQPAGANLTENQSLEKAAKHAIAISREYSDRAKSSFSPAEGAPLAAALSNLDTSIQAADDSLKIYSDAIRPESYASTLISRSNRLSRALTDVHNEKSLHRLAASGQNATWLYLTCFLMFLGSLATHLLVFRPMDAQTRRRQSELEASKETVESQLKTITEQSAELVQQKAELKQQLDDVNVISNNFQLATSRLQKVLGNLPIACIGVSVDGRVYEWNGAAQQTFGYSLFDLFESSLAATIVGTEDREEFEAKIRQALEEDQPVQFECPTVGKEGQRSMIEWSMMPMRGANGEHSGLQLTANDVTERVLQADKLKDLAFKDALTGLCNRRSFLDALHKSYPDVTPSNPCSVVLMDVDKFKNYNDSYGHPEGDALLRRVGEIMTELVPEPFLPARYGGEEFVVFLAGADESKAFEMAEVLRQAIEARTQDLHGATASFGVSSSINPDFPVTEMIEQADKALYFSKHMGRNRTSVWSPDLGHDAAA